MSTLLLDANIILRFLLRDQEDHFQRVAALLLQAQEGKFTLIVTHSVLVEVVFTLSSFYKHPRPAIAMQLIGFLHNAGIEPREKQILFDALQRYAAKGVSFVDALLAAESAASTIPVASFDRDFDKFKDIKRHVP